MRKNVKNGLAAAVCVLFVFIIAVFAEQSTARAVGASWSDGISYAVKNTDADIGTEENPFTILEIVPNPGMAMIGYLIPGCEPIDVHAIMQDDILKYDFVSVMGNYFEFGEEGTYSNRDLLIPALFDGASTYDGFCSQVITVTPDELTDKNLGLIDAADMIVISALRDAGNLPVYWQAHNKKGIGLTEEQQGQISFNGRDGNDLSWNTVMAIIERMASDHPAALMIQDTEQSGEADYNIEKLYLMLMQYGPKTFYDYFAKDNSGFVSQEVTVDDRTFVTGAYKSSEDASAVTVWNEETFLTQYGISVMHESQILVRGGIEVFGNIVTFGGNWNVYTDFSEITPAGYGDDDYRQGGNSELFDFYEEQTGSRAATLDMGQALYYALQYAGGNLGYKKSLHILEVSPNSEFIYGEEGWQLFYKSMIPWFAGDIETDVEITTMPSYEFIGDMTDLNAEYDLIFFNARQDASNGLYGYNDSALNKGAWEGSIRKGYIYSSVGDYVSRRWLNLASYRGYRYSSNDLTRKKLVELLDFLQAGKPIIVDKSFYSGMQVDTTKIDADSYMYQLASLVCVEGTNDSTLFCSGYYYGSSGRNLLRDALAKETCHISFGEDGYPTVYTAATGDGYAYVKGSDGSVSQTIAVSGVIQQEQYNTMTDASGNPILYYAFTVEGTAESVYGLHIYIDSDGDGIYSGSMKEQKEVQAAGDRGVSTAGEELTGAAVMDVTDGNGMAVTDGKLYAGHSYVVTAPVPSNKRGIIPWKLELVNLANDSIRDSAVNYTAFEAADSAKETIHVLQMNLMPDMTKDAATYVNFADTTTVTGAKFAAYLSAVADFNVEIAFMENSDWYRAYGENGSYAKSNHATKEEMVERFKAYLDDVDMLIIGYCDVAAFTSDEVFYEAFMDFVNQGKSVILSHDLVHDDAISTEYTDKVSQYDAVIRTLAGQRRTREGVAVENEYMDNNVRMLIYYGAAEHIYDRVVPADTDFIWPNAVMTTQISLANRGQITSYPYALPDTITISGTHAQNFQLDLEYSDSGDVNVWYNLSGGLYDGRWQDARNNYYIYTKGNITYTGLGHLDDSLTDDEVKLFVNTMISSYRVTPEKPYIKVTNSDAAEKDHTYTMYVMLTGAEKETDMLKVHFTVVQEGLDEGTGRQYTLRYQDADGNAISPQTATSDVGNDTLLTSGEDGYAVAKNGTYAFDVAYKDVMEQGSVTCYLNLLSSYYDGDKLVETEKVTKVIVYAMPLFELN